LRIRRVSAGPVAGANYAPAAGRGSQTFSISDTCRRALLGSAAAGAMLFGYGRSARAGPDLCGTAGNTATCQGDQSAGIASGTDFTAPPVDTLEVNNLTDVDNDGIAIEPGTGVDGISFISAGNITITSDLSSSLGLLSIEVTGANVDGISANATAGGLVDVYSRGIITTTASANTDTRGIWAYSEAPGNALGASIESHGDISAATSGTGYAYGLHAHALSTVAGNAGSAAIVSTGKFVVAGEYVANGLLARSAAEGGAASTATIAHTGDVDVTSQSVNQFSRAAGIGAGSTAAQETGSASVTLTGNVSAIASANGFGVTFAQGVSVSSVSAYANAASASFLGNGDIYARAEMGAAGFGADATGITAFAQSIDGIGTTVGDISISHTGDITVSATALGYVTGGFAGTRGITAQNLASRGSVDGILVETSGDVKITSRSDGGASAYGITASTAARYGTSEIVSVHHTGDIVAEAFGGGATFYNTFARGIAAISRTYLTGQASGIQVLVTGDVAASATGGAQSYAFGIVANSTGPNAGDVLIEVDGNVTATAATLAAGISAQSDGVLADGDIEVLIKSGDVFGEDVGVRLQSGATNSIENHGSIAGGTFAVQSDTGNETINNYGLITGNVDLGTGTNAFNNLAGSTFRSGTIANVGVGNTLTNSGDLTPGGTGAIVVTALTGTLVQDITGTFTVDLDEGAAQEADLLTVTAGTASFQGFVDPNILNITSPSGMVLIASASAISSTATALDEGGYDFSLVLMSGDTQLWLRWQLASILSLINGPLTPNQLATAQYLDAIGQSNPSAQMQALLDAIRGLPNEAAIIAALDRLHAEHYLAQVNDTLHASLFFLSGIMSCPTGNGAYAVVAEDQCVWARVGGRTFDQDRTWTNIGGDVEAWNVSAGAQVALQGNWRLGFAGAYEQVNLKTNNDASSDGDRIEGAVVLKNRWGGTTLAAAAFGGYGWFDTTRSIALAGIATAEGDQNIAFGGVHSRLAHLVAKGPDWYLKPLIDLNATYIEYGDVTETAGGAAALSIQGNDDWVLSASPAIELGGNMKMGGSVVRPFVRAGVTVFDDMEFALTSSFLAAPAAVAPFTVASQFDRVYFDVAAGIDVLSAGGIEVKVNYDGRFSEDSDSHAGGIKVGAQF
jgi:hypothetical protein